MKKSKKILLLAVVTVLLATTFLFNASALTYNGIAGNGTDGIYIDIYSAPYTTYAQKTPVAYGSQGCTWFAAARACQLTGKQVPHWTGAKWWNNYYADYGFTRGSTVRAYSLACFTNHVEVVEKVDGNMVTVSTGGAGDKANNDYCAIRKMTIYDLENNRGISGNFLGYVYLDGHISSWKTSASKVNLGDSFYARIVNTAMDKPLTVQSDDNVVIYDRNNSKNQIWKFTRNNDGSYAIISLYNEKSLDVYGAYNAASTNLQTYAYNNNPAQQWGIYGSDGNYFLSAACTDCVVDVSGANSENGTNVLLYTKNDSIAQLYTIEKIPAPTKPALTTSASGKSTVFKWSKASNASSYDLKIMKDGATYKTISSVAYKTVSDSKNVTYTLSLPNGIYTAVLTAKNLACSTNSDTIRIIVNNNPDESGWKYATSLPSGVTSKYYKIQYCPTYTKVAKTSPGSAWVKGSVAKKVYENSGDVYYSDFPLETSQTRELVNTSYYHWCSGSNQHVNFAQTSTYGHYDGMSNANVVEYSSHADADDSRYTYYVLKYKDSGAYAYCQSGVTCDGAYGSHGNRSYYWYKTYAYQDKAAVNYYNFTKQGDWSDTKDSTASSHIVRYKEIAHSYTSKVTKATLTSNGKIKTVCSGCGYVKSTKTISTPKTFTLSTTSYTFNGKVKTPTVTVKDAAGNVLTKGTDYTVTYASGRKSVGTYKVTIKMIGNYSGTKTLSFKIKPVDISSCTVKLSNTSYTFNGKVKTPTVTITSPHGTKLTKGTSYTVTYSSGRKTPGTYKVTVKMKGNYTGTKTLSFKIKPIDISACKIKLSNTSYTYNGKVKTPTVTVTNPYGVKLTKDVSYTVSYSTGRKTPGTYKVTVKMKGYYTGTKTLTFKIKPIDISTCTVKLSNTSYTYNGKVKTPTVTVTNAYGTKLTKGTSYTVSYSSGRTKVGTYKVTVKMKGYYTGTKTLTFKINPPKTTVASLKAGTKSITVNLEKKTTQVTGYQIQYSTDMNFKNAKTKTLTSSSTVRTTLSSLGSAKTYYVRVRTYKTVNDVKYYSGWSAYRYVKTK